MIVEMQAVDAGRRWRPVLAENGGKVGELRPCLLGGGEVRCGQRVFFDQMKCRQRQLRPPATCHVARNSPSPAKPVSRMTKRSLSRQRCGGSLPPRKTYRAWASPPWVEW